MNSDFNLIRHFAENGALISVPFCLPDAAAVGALIALLATVGDLIESRFKRACGVKDSATFMPAGMGGFLDMFDSILFIPALLYFPLFYLNVYS